MNARRQDILRAYHQMAVALAYQQFQLAEEEEGRRVYEEWQSMWE